MARTSVKDIVDQLGMTVYAGEEMIYREIKVSDISRPGLELNGYFNYYPADRVQLFGQNEYSFMSTLPSDKIREVIQKMATTQTPCLIFSRGLVPPDEVINVAKEMKIPLLGHSAITTQLTTMLTTFLQERLAPRVSRHGVLVEVYGLGVFITGDSGIGKSETGLELIKNGHRLVADDRVEFHKRDETTVVGEAPEILKNMIEIRGLGIINVMTLFGTGAVRDNQELDMIVHLAKWDKGAKYDRLGSEPEWVDLFDIKIPRYTIPIASGRNSSNIVEVAAMNFRANQMGYNSTEMFEKRLTDLIRRNEEEDRIIRQYKD